METQDEFALAKKLIYKPCGYKATSPVAELESSDYQACDFKLGKISVKFRTAKITPTKVGQFVTLWKRIGNGPIEPFDVADPVDLFIISVRDKTNCGQFIFSKTVLHKNGVLSQNKKGGKRAIRVYPPWVTTTSNQAKKTQAWQVPYFVAMSDRQPIDLNLVKKLLKS